METYDMVQELKETLKTMRDDAEIERGLCPSKKQYYTGICAALGLAIGGLTGILDRLDSNERKKGT